MRKSPSFPVVAVALWALAGLGCAKKTAPAVTSGTATAGSGWDAGGVPDAGGAAVTASFDCKKAASKVELIICASPELSRLDGEMAAAFKQALGGYLHPEVLREAQRTWLRATRNQAADEAALRKAYTERLKALRIDGEGSQEIVSGDLAWRMMGYGKGIELPVIIRWRNAEAKERINAALAEAASNMGCMNEPEDGAAASEFWMRASVAYAEHDIFSVEIHEGYSYSGTAHPTNDANLSMTFDLRTGSEVRFVDLSRSCRTPSRPSPTRSRCPTPTSRGSPTARGCWRGSSEARA